MRKIYLVECGEGEWEDSYSWIEKAFVNRNKAEKFAKEVDEKHDYQPVFDSELWDEITCQVEEYFEKYPDTCFNEFCGKKDCYDKWKKRDEEINELEKSLYLKFLLEKNHSATIEEVNKQMEFEENKWKHYHVSRVIEMDLDEDDE